MYVWFLNGDFITLPQFNHFSFTGRMGNKTLYVRGNKVSISPTIEEKRYEH